MGWVIPARAYYITNSDSCGDRSVLTNIARTCLYAHGHAYMSQYAMQESHIRSHIYETSSNTYNIIILCSHKMMLSHTLDGYECTEHADA